MKVVGLFFLRALLLLYRGVLSPAVVFLTGTPSLCRFVPSCSVYAEESIVRFGWRRGLVLSVRRLLRCRPRLSRTSPEQRGLQWDPVPPPPPPPPPPPSPFFRPRV